MNGSMHKCRYVRVEMSNCLQCDGTESGGRSSFVRRSVGSLTSWGVALSRCAAG